MTSSSVTSAAQRLWARAASGSSEPERVVAAAELLCARLRTELGRWIGADGYRVLLERALGLARAEHAALRDLSCFGGDEAATTNAVQTHGAAQVGDAIVTLLTALIELLGRIIGDEMAVQLVEQIDLASPSAAESTVSPGSNRGRNG
jgi:hypothetical protein